MRISTLTPLLAALPTAYSAITKPEINNTTALPMHFGLLVFPGFQALDVFGPMDVFNSLALLFKLPMTISILSTTLDPVSSSVSGVMKNMSHGDFGEAVVPTDTFKNYLTRLSQTPLQVRHEGHEGHEEGIEEKKPCGHKKAETADIEVLIVPGGGGTRQPLLEEIDFVKAMYPKVKYILTVCTGATIAARGGVLDGRRATTNKMAWKWATSTGPNVTWVGHARWVDDGNIWTSSGVSAGSDMAYAWVASVYGEEVADYLSKAAEYNRWLDANNDPFAAIHDVPA
ncbi:DJ-1/PfpI family protein [Melanomma pulvis-pyrius CBS 109.77]|uniref:DJ-1/PfpI family protein n=1 Tax=Melanomma pulvis-pyrius CBS 109.77 TaxID=1314802 RepID=A0A6A6XW92_9PLEO|nr:DJ-1/PfpI family protein [Melanomma pulvis-pyrius CBS 109.77]